MWRVSVAFTVELFEYFSTLILICAQFGRVLGREGKTDPASSAWSSGKGLKENKNGLLGIVSKFCISFGKEIKISICGGLDSDCTVVNLHRVVTFRVKHLNSDIEQTRRAIILISLLFILLVLIRPLRFLNETDRKQTGL